MATDITASLARSAAVKSAAASAKADSPKVEVRQNLPGQGQDAPRQEAPPVRQISLDQAVSAINHYVQNLRRDLQFTIDEQTNRTVIKVIDSETQEVIRQIPQEEVIALAHSLEKAQGLILSAQA
ncbi:MAG TPA: flagellar protein FlaG [Gammaproteobacteria bacterium]|nr:flagellar protein FlaG [Gammaproteobacteria bacterium]